jgi:tetratricopeptide (TPR) repeat protein
MPTAPWPATVAQLAAAVIRCRSARDEAGARRAADELRARGLDAIERGDTAAALGVASLLHRARCVAGFEIAALAHERDGDRARAIEAAERATREAPWAWTSWHLAASLYAKGGRHRDAIGALERALACLERCGGAGEGELEERVEVIEAVRRELSAAHVGEARALWERDGDAKRATDDARRAFSLDPGNEEALGLLREIRGMRSPVSRLFDLWVRARRWPGPQGTADPTEEVAQRFGVVADNTEEALSFVAELLGCEVGAGLRIDRSEAVAPMPEASKGVLRASEAVVAAADQCGSPNT